MKIDEELRNIQNAGDTRLWEKAKENAERLLPAVLNILQEKAKRGEALNLNVWPPYMEGDRDSIKGENLYLFYETHIVLTSLLQKNLPSYSVSEDFLSINVEKKKKSFKNIGLMFIILGILLLGLVYVCASG